MRGSGGQQTTNNTHVAATPALAGLLMVAQRLARSPSRCFFIGGDAGVGKCMLAWFIHNESLRADRPYMFADLAAMPPEQMDLALFGSEGLLVSADGGTVLLQEITTLPNRLQRKLLQVLQERTFETADGGSTCTVDVRIIVTSNYDLEGADREMLREDLRYRITAVQLHVPALRYRRDDVLALATHFLLNANVGQDRNVGFAPQAIDALQAYPWPHNVHELRQVVETAAATMMRHGRTTLVASDLNLPATLPSAMPRSSRPPPSPVLSFAVGSMPALALTPTGTVAEKAGHGQQAAQDATAGPAPTPALDAPWSIPQYRAPTIQGVSAERLWAELQRNGANE